MNIDQVTPAQRQQEIMLLAERVVDMLRDEHLILEECRQVLRMALSLLRDSDIGKYAGKGRSREN